MERIVTITFPKGKVKAVWVDYGQFITDEPLSEELKSDLSMVTVATPDQKFFTLINPIIIEVAATDDKYHFIFDTIPEDERRLRELRSDIEYIAMMSDIDL